MMTRAAIIFDCDGVIIESADIKSRAFHALAAPFGVDAQQEFLEYHEQHTGISRFVKFSWLYDTFAKRPITTEESRLLGEQFTQRCIDGILAAPFVTGFQEVIAAYAGRIPLFVASGTPHDELLTVLNHRGLHPVFTGIFGSPPDKTTLVQSIIENHALEPRFTLMIGDGETDYIAAKAAGCLFYGRGNRFSNRDCPWSDDLIPVASYMNTVLEQMRDEVFQRQSHA